MNKINMTGIGCAYSVTCPQKSVLRNQIKFCIKYFYLLLFLLLFNNIHAQETQKEKNWQLRGYIKNLQTLSIIDAGINADKQWLTDNLIHNRLNFKWYINDKFTFKADLRNRILFGESTKLNTTFNPDYAQNLNDASNDFFKLSWLTIDKKPIIMHSVIDRLYMEWVQGNWEVRLGRQRINWGISTVWNPNDIFNAFSYTDFDYEERPGSDALRIKYYTGYAGSLELAIKAFDDIDEAVAAALWKFNKWNYDFQILAGVVNQNIALGGGWAGNIKNASFKGEFTYFEALEEGEESSFAATVGVDYSFKNSLYLSGGFLFNSNGQTTGSISQLFTFELSAQNLYPYKYAFFVSAGYPLSPLLGGTVALIYSPADSNPLFLTPALTYSIKENWDLDLIGQLIFNKEDNRDYFSPIQALYLRIKFSF